jgi:CRP-like cAMP-binding protein
MISVELLRQYPFFSKLSEEQLAFLVSVAREETVEVGQFVCKNGVELDHFYLIIEGNLEVLFELPQLIVNYKAIGQPSQIQSEFMNVGRLDPGDICGWSGLVPPYIATSSVRAVSQSNLILFDAKKLLEVFEDDCRFGFFMIQAAAQAIGKRLQNVYKKKTKERTQ